MQWYGVFSVLAFLAVTASPVLCDVDANQQASLNNLLTSQLPSFNVSEIPTIDDAERLFKEKCLRVTNLAAYEHAKEAKEVFRVCVQGLVNTTVLKQEIEAAKPTGDLDVVFSKYCRKTPQLRQCANSFSNAVQPCLTDSEREMQRIIQNITDNLAKFICYRDGDRIALFIAEGGPECVSAHQDDIQQCLNQTLSKHIPTSTPNLTNLPVFVLGPEQCKDLGTVQRCIVRKLEDCQEPTTANIVEALFNFVNKVTPCGRLKLRNN